MANVEVKFTEGPRVGFGSNGQVFAIMPAGRSGDICSFAMPPKEADARLMIKAPTMHDALDRIFSYVSYINIHGVGEQIEPIEGCPQPVRVAPEELLLIIQAIGNLAASALEGDA